MTDTPRKISELTALTAPAAEDYLPIVDVSEPTLAAKNKRITAEALVSNAPFTQSGNGAVARTINSKLKDIVHVKDFGAAGDGVTDDTAAIKAALEYAISINGTVVLDGDYLVSNVLLTIATISGSKKLSINVARASTITFNAASPYIDYLFYFQTSGVNTFSLTGSALTVNLNNKAKGFYVRTLSSTTGGSCDIDLPLTILNAKDASSTAGGSVSALAVFGQYSSVRINRVTVDGVSRTIANGVCQAIVVSGTPGVVHIKNCSISNVSYVAGGTDADGLVCFGLNATVGSGYTTSGTFYIDDCVFSDCAGRAIKLQANDVTITNPVIRRQYLVGFTNSVDIDFQFGGGTLVNPTFQYRLNSGVTPLGSSHNCIAFSHSTVNADTIARVLNANILTEVAIPGVILASNISSAQYTSTTLNGLNVSQIGTLTTEALSRVVIEYPNADNIASKTKETYIGCFNVRGAMGGLGLIGYSGYTGTTVSNKLTVDIDNCSNYFVTGTTVNRAINKLSGSQIASFKSIRFGRVFNYSILAPDAFVFDYKTIPAGSSFIYTIATATASNAPPSLGSTGYALVECLGQWLNTTSKMLRVTKDNATTTNTVFYSYDGSTWGTIK